jgi:hypothetical protein
MTEDEYFYFETLQKSGLPVAWLFYFDHETFL